jgi:hypothetical protein
MKLLNGSQFVTAVYLGKAENTQVTILSFLGTKQISAPTVRCTNSMFIYMYHYSENEDLSTAVKLSFATVTLSHADNGGPSGCVCNMAVHLMESDCRRVVSQCRHSDFSTTIRQSGKLSKLRARFVFVEVQLRTPFFHHMT